MTPSNLRESPEGIEIVTKLMNVEIFCFTIHAYLFINVFFFLFVSGVDAAKWNLDVFLRSLWYLFHDSPARREDFLTVADSSSLPKKFVSHR